MVSCERVAYPYVSDGPFSDGPYGELFLLAPRGGAMKSLTPHNKTGLHDILFLSSRYKRPGMSLDKQGLKKNMDKVSDLQQYDRPLIK